MRVRPGVVGPPDRLEEGSGNLIKVAKPTSSGSVRVTFVLPATEPAGAVSVVGDFNGWDPYAHPLRKRSNGVRSAVVNIPAGSTLRFRYLAEGGIWFDDETATMRNDQDAVITIPA
jgi:1,4-alpha-glucan branching enzyme